MNQLHGFKLEDLSYTFGVDGELFFTVAPIGTLTLQRHFYARWAWHLI